MLLQNPSLPYHPLWVPMIFLLRLRGVRGRNHALSIAWRGFKGYPGRVAMTATWEGCPNLYSLDNPSCFSHVWLTPSCLFSRSLLSVCLSVCLPACLLAVCQSVSLSLYLYRRFRFAWVSPPLSSFTLFVARIHKMNSKSISTRKDICIYADGTRNGP